MNGDSKLPAASNSADSFGHSVADAEARATFLQQLRWRLATAKPKSPRRRQRAGMTSIVIPTHNQLAYTEMCLASVRLFTEEPYELLVVDNASTDGTVPFLREQRDVRLFENPINRGFAPACNLGMAHASGDQLLLLNNDVIVTQGWLDRLSDALQSDSTLGLAGPVSNNVSGEQCIPTGYRDLTELEAFAARNAEQKPGRVERVARLVGFCLLIRRSVLDQIGYLDERFGIGMFEDDDYVQRASAAGFAATIAHDAFVHHFGSMSFRSMGFEKAKEVFDENRRVFEAKWTEPRSDLPAVATPMDERGKLRKRRPKKRGKSERVKLSLCMIVRDNESTIRPALDSIRPWVDEMVVVDTGSNDRTRQIAEELGARVFNFAWCESFSAARNESLRHAQGEWVFWMDSDDTISPVNGRRLQELVGNSIPTQVMGFVLQVHCPGPPASDECDLTVVDHVKVFRNDPALRFEGRIHEQILPAINRRQGKVEWTDIFVEHSGYDHSPAAQERKKARDLRLLHLELSDQPDHPFTLFNLGMTYAHTGAPAEAIPYLHRSIELSDPQDSHVRKAYALLVHALKDLERLDEALSICDKAIEMYPRDLELRFRRGVLLHTAGRLADAREVYQSVLTIEPERKFNSLDPGIRSFKTRQNLAALCMEVGDFQEAEKQCRLIVAEVPKYRAGWRALGDVLARQARWQDVETLSAWLVQQSSIAVEGWLLRAKAAQHQGDMARTRQMLQNARATAPSQVEPLKQLCEVLFAHGPPEEALVALEELARSEPTDAQANHNLGTAYLRAHRFQDAVQAYRRAIELRPDFFHTWVYLGWTLRELGQTDEALAAYARAVSLAGTPQEEAEAEQLRSAVGPWYAA